MGDERKQVRTNGLCEEDRWLRKLDALAPAAQLVQRYCGSGETRGVLSDVIAIEQACEKDTVAQARCLSTLAKYAKEVRSAVMDLRGARRDGVDAFAAEIRVAARALKDCAQLLESRGMAHVARQIWAGPEDVLSSELSKSSAMAI